MAFSRLALTATLLIAFCCYAYCEPFEKLTTPLAANKYLKLSSDDKWTYLSYGEVGRIYVGHRKGCTSVTEDQTPANCGTHANDRISGTVRYLCGEKDKIIKLVNDFKTGTLEDPFDFTLPIVKAGMTADTPAAFADNNGLALENIPSNNLISVSTADLEANKVMVVKYGECTDATKYAEFWAALVKHFADDEVLTHACFEFKTAQHETDNHYGGGNRCLASAQDLRLGDLFKNKVPIGGCNVKGCDCDTVFSHVLNKLKDDPTACMHKMCSSASSTFSMTAALFALTLFIVAYFS